VPVLTAVVRAATPARAVTKFHETIPGGFGLSRQPFEVGLRSHLLLESLMCRKFLHVRSMESWGKRSVSTISHAKVRQSRNYIPARLSALHPDLLLETDYVDILSRTVFALRGDPTQTTRIPGSDLLSRRGVYDFVEMAYQPSRHQPLPPGSQGPF
jgi:hypothetical protein